MNDLKIVPVVDKRGIESFIAAARRAQAGNTRWIEPVHDEIRMIFNPRRTPFMRENVVQPFVALLDGEPVGRIVATIDSRHIGKFDDACGFFGFIEAVDDRAVFAGLFHEAEQFLRDRGMKVARGPFSLTINHESGLLVHGFDQPHVVRTNHAPPYYSRHIESLGYAKAMDLLAYVCRVSESGYPERVARVAGARGAPRIEYHSLSLWNWGRTFPRVLALYNDAWSDNAWATPVGEEEAKLIGRLMLPVCHPGWIRIRDRRWRGCRGGGANSRCKRGAPGPPREASAVWLGSAPVAHSRARHPHDPSPDDRSCEEMAQHESGVSCDQPVS